MGGRKVYVPADFEISAGDKLHLYNAVGDFWHPVTVVRVLAGNRVRVRYESGGLKGEVRLAVAGKLSRTLPEGARTRLDPIGDGAAVGTDQG